MDLVKPSWVHHNGKPIFSVDIHPDGTRFVTGGQGEDCGKIAIWAMEPLRSPQAEKNETKSKMLYQMEHHIGCVNCVRWSHNGRFLASGSDDKLIMIWQRSKSGGIGQFREYWQCVETLRAHTGDVLDLAWCPDDRYLASSSVDNSIVIWNARKFPEMVTVIRGHSGLVKGVAWDPLGRFLASQSDDKSVAVWRTRDWQREAVITEPFKECGGTTHVLRLNWSPDGQYLVTAHAMNNRGPTAQIIDRRNEWDTPADFVGHRKAVTVVRFHPSIFSRSVNGKERFGCVCALGSRDRSLTVWMTLYQRPLVAVCDIFESTVLDLAWHGSELLACSFDGTVAFLRFRSLGGQLAGEERRALLHRLYGPSPDELIIENAEMLSVPAPAPVAPAPAPPPQVREESRPAQPQQQQESRTADGRRRITPVLVQAAPELIQTAFAESAPNTPPAAAVSDGGASQTAPTTNGPSMAAMMASPEPITALRTESKADAKTEAKSDVKTDSKADAKADSKSESKPESKPRPRASKPEPPKRNRAKPAETRVVHEDKAPPGKASLLSLPALADALSVPVGADVVVEVDNEPLCKELYRIRAMKGEQVLWEAALCARSLVLDASESLVCVGCEDRSAHLFDAESGRMLAPALLLPGKPALVRCRTKYALLITVPGNVFVWNAIALTALVRNVSLRPLLQAQDASLSHCALSESGMPLLTLSTGRTFTYCPDLASWCLLHAPDPVFRLASVRPSLRGGTLSSLQTEAGPPPEHASAEAHRLCTATFLRRSLCAAHVLKSPDEWKHSLLAYTKFLVDNNEDKELRSLCAHLLPAPHEPQALLGIPKRELLSLVLRTVSTNLKMQRLFTEFQEQLAADPDPF